MDFIGDRPEVAAAIKDLKRVFKVFDDPNDSTPPTVLLDNALMSAHSKCHCNDNNIAFLVGSMLFKVRRRFKHLLLLRLY